MPDAPIVDVRTTIKVSGEIKAYSPILRVWIAISMTPQYMQRYPSVAIMVIEDHHHIALEKNSNIATNTGDSNRFLNFEFLRQHQKIL
jgi:hypothetical protein